MQSPAQAQAQQLPWRHPRGGGSTSVRIAVLGDLHNDFSLLEDGAALQWLQPDMTVIVGDLTNEGPALVEQIVQLAVRKAVILGNHDAWRTGREIKTKVFKPPPNPQGGPPMSLADAIRGGRQADELGKEHEEVQAALERLPGGARNAVVRQLELLGETHVGYAGLQVPGKRVSIAGARPFSHGGDRFFHVVGLTSTLWPGVDGFKASAERIQAAVRAEQDKGSEAVVLVGHNAPTGLGSAQHDVAGADFLPGEGDHGDIDLRMALDALNHEGLRVPLVLCGHMHHKLKDGTLRRMAHVDATTGLVTLNAAVVPRVQRAPPPPPTVPGRVGSASNRHFLLVEMQEGRVVHAQHVWVHVASALTAREQLELVQQGVSGQTGCECSLHKAEDVLTAQAGEAGSNYRVWDAQYGVWTEVFVPAAREAVAVAGA